MWLILGGWQEMPGGSSGGKGGGARTAGGTGQEGWRLCAKLALYPTRSRKLLQLSQQSALSPTPLPAGASLGSHHVRHCANFGHAPTPAHGQKPTLAELWLPTVLAVASMRLGRVFIPPAAPRVGPSPAVNGSLSRTGSGMSNALCSSEQNLSAAVEAQGKVWRQVLFEIRICSGGHWEEYLLLAALLGFTRHWSWLGAGPQPGGVSGSRCPGFPLEELPACGCPKVNGTVQCPSFPFLTAGHTCLTQPCPL